jgi:hypothetical protein
MAKMNKRGQMEGLQKFVLGVGGVAVVLVVALVILTQLQTVADQPSKYCGTGYTYNASQADGVRCQNTSVGGGGVDITRTAEYTATSTMAAKLGTIPTWVGIVIVVALAFLVLGFFYGKSNNFW